MITIDFDNIFNVSANHGISPDEFKNSGQEIPALLRKIENNGNPFYQIVDDEKIVKKIVDYSKSVEGKYEDIILIGIGGQALGARFLKTAFTSFINNSNPKLHVWDNIDPMLISEMSSKINYSKTLFIISSKSGNTPETLAQFFYFKSRVEMHELNVKNHFVFIIGDEEGLLQEIVKKEKYLSFKMPKNLGGRFSILSAAGLLPASLIGIDIKQLIDGAKIMKDKFLSVDSEENLPFKLAVTQYFGFTKGKTQNVLFPYTEKLRGFSDWFVQLLAESTGKLDVHGNNVGITPVPAIGVTDQHSQLQLFIEGPNDKLTIFLKVEYFKENPEIPVLINHEKVNFLKEVSFGKLLHTELKATADTLAENNRPNITISISEISEETVGSLIMLLEGSTAFLGEYLNINAFDQPGVERVKALTREYLNK